MKCTDCGESLRPEYAHAHRCASIASNSLANQLEAMTAERDRLREGVILWKTTAEANSQFASTEKEWKDQLRVIVEKLRAKNDALQSRCERLEVALSDTNAILESICGDGREQAQAQIKENEALLPSEAPKAVGKESETMNDPQENWICHICGWKGLELTYLEVAPAHERYHSKQGTRCTNSMMHIYPPKIGRQPAPEAQNHPQATCPVRHLWGHAGDDGYRYCIACGAKQFDAAEVRQPASEESSAVEKPIDWNLLYGMEVQKNNNFKAELSRRANVTQEELEWLLQMVMKDRDISIKEGDKCSSIRSKAIHPHNTAPTDAEGKGDAV